jgi:hypothetical protein
VVAAGLLALPLAALVALALAYPVLLTVQLLWPPGGAAAVERWRELAAWISGPAIVGSLVPRLVTVTILVAAATALIVFAFARWRHGATRHGRGALWWQALGAPLDAAEAVRWACDGFWSFMRGAAAIAQPSATELSRRYAELLAESLGQPGYRELILLAHDLDARRDTVFALLDGAWRKRFVARQHGAGAAELVDLAGAGRIHVVDALAAALSPPVICNPRAVAFAPESFWRGETHRLCDRPSAVARLIAEVADAGATQVILVSATAPLEAPHTLTRPGTSPRDRVGEALDATETAAVGDAIAGAQGRARGLFHVRPAHNPVGAFAFAGGSDQRSQRSVALCELVDRGYEDAYRQFIEPVIGASGEQIHGAVVVGPTPLPDDLPLKTPQG